MYNYIKEKIYFIRLRKLQRLIIRQLKNIHDYFTSQTDYYIKIKIHLPKPDEEISSNNQSCYRIYFSADNINWNYIDVAKHYDAKDVFSEWKTKLCFSPNEAVNCVCPVQRDLCVLFNKLYPDEFVNEFIYSKDVIIPMRI